MNAEPVSLKAKEAWETKKFSALSPASTLYLRAARVSDIQTMVELEKEVWDDEHAATTRVIEQRLHANPECTIIAFTADQTQALGFFKFVGTSHDEVSVLRTWEYYADMAGRTWESGEVHYGVSLTVSKHAPRGTGTCIMQAASEYSKRLGAQRIIAVTRAPAFHRVQGAMSFDEYYNLLRSGKMKEPLYFLFSSAGWQLVGYCSDYYPDPESCDYGLHFEA